MQYRLVDSRFLLQYKLYSEPGWAYVTIQHGLGSWGAGVGAGRAGGRAGGRRARKALGARVLGERAQAGGRCRRAGRSAAGWASGSRRAGRAAGARGAQQARGARSRRAGRAAGARGAQQARGARGQGMDARGRAAGVGRGARGSRLGGMCTSGVRSWARLGVLVHLTQFLALFDSVFFPSHQMNTVHCKINFFLKKNIYFKFKNQIKSNQI